MTRDPARIAPLLARLNAAWSSQPDLRLGQIFSNLIRSMPANLYFVEDDELITLIEQQLLTVPVSITAEEPTP